MSERDEDYENTRYIPQGGDYPALWSRAAADFRQKHPPLDYGGGDLFLPHGPAAGLMVFIHGGYWMETGREDWSHLARGALAHGWAAALPSYRLAPLARISQIVEEVAQGIAKAAVRVDGPIALCGHSAGGHLAARMMCKNSPLPEDILSRCVSCVPISGLFDLRPLLQTSMNKVLRLDPQEAEAQSPILLEPRPDIPLTAWVGAQERPEFIRQSRDFVAEWQKCGARVSLYEEPARHHFDVIEGLGDPRHPIWAPLLGV